jgi:hypothetical protein
MAKTNPHEEKNRWIKALRLADELEGYDLDLVRQMEDCHWRGVIDAINQEEARLQPEARKRRRRFDPPSEKCKELVFTRLEMRKKRGSRDAFPPRDMRYYVNAFEKPGGAA